MALNRLCCWYWIWRSQFAAKSGRTSGNETANLELSSLFKAAKINHLENRFLSRGWSQHFADEIDELDPLLRALMLAAQNDAIFPAELRSCLIAAIGCKTDVPSEMLSEKVAGQGEAGIAKLYSSRADSSESNITIDQRHKLQISEIESLYKEKLAAKDSEIAKKETEWNSQLAEKEQFWISDISAKENELACIYNSRSWAALIYLLRLRQLLLPAGSVREKLARGVYRAAKKTYKSCDAILPSLASIFRKRSVASAYKKLSPEKYDVFFFSVIEWDFRFQRPQQMARQFARAGHRVFYVSQKFTARKNVKIRPIEENIFELTLGGDPAINVYKHRPSENILHKMADSLYSFCLDSKCSTGILLVQLPFWTSLAEELRTRFGWPIVYDCMDEHAGFSTNGQSMLSIEQRLLEQADLTLVSSGLLEKKALGKSRRVAVVRNAADYEHFAPVAGMRKLTRFEKHYSRLLWSDCRLVRHPIGRRPG